MRKLARRFLSSTKGASLTWMAAFLVLFPLSVFLFHWFWQIPDPIGSRIDLFLEGTRNTLLLTLASSTAGLALGLIFALFRLSHWKLLQTISIFYTWVMQGTPLLVQVFFFYFALPTSWNEWIAAVVALSFNIGAYHAQVIRAGIRAVPEEQIEAAKSMGLTLVQRYRWVILPQAFRIMFPPLLSNVVALLKDSAMVSSIGLLELTLTGNRLATETFHPLPILVTVAVIYLYLTTVITWLAKILERQTAQGT